MAKAEDQRVEALAEYAHEAWSGWMRYLFSKCEQDFDSDGYDALVIPNWAVERWARQAKTPYKYLPEEEKITDRDEARRILRTLEGTDGR